MVVKAPKPAKIISIGRTKRPDDKVSNFKKKAINDLKETLISRTKVFVLLFEDD